MSNNGGIICEICGEEVHSIQLHIKEKHHDWDIKGYQNVYPDSPLLSDLAAKKIAEKARTKEEAVAITTEMVTGSPAAAPAPVVSIETDSHAPMHEVFGFGEMKEARNRKGGPIPITVLGSRKFEDMIPDKDENYVLDVNLVKDVLLGLELNIPVYLWGHAGVGKTTIYEQVCHHTNRPTIRIQHTIDTESMHIVGSMLANKEGTYFEPGPLPLAMKNGWVYNADEYDYAHPSVLAVYQAVLEGKPLIIKEAPSDWRVVKPHPNFRFVASGNSNGSGDEHGLYPGVEMGNAANYSRFGITCKVNYMSKAQETEVICKQAGVAEKDARKIVEFAGSIRKAFETNKMSATVGPRELIYAAKVGLRKGSWRAGIDLAYINRLNETDREIATGMSQRIFSKS